MSFDQEEARLPCPGKSRPLQGAGAEHFVLAEGFEGGSGYAGHGNRVAQRVEDFDGVPLCAIRGHVMVHYAVSHRSCCSVSA